MHARNSWVLPDQVCWCNIKQFFLREFFHKLHLLIYASQFMTSHIISLTFVLLNWKGKKIQKFEYFEIYKKIFFFWKTKKSMYLTGTVFKVLKNMKKTFFPPPGTMCFIPSYQKHLDVYVKCNQKSNLLQVWHSDLILYTPKQTHRVHTGTKRLK